MKNLYTSEQLEKIRGQTAMYQCACPAQVCKAIEQTRYLYNYQQDCLSEKDNQLEVHKVISVAAKQAHEIFENCLTQVLEIEGWDSESLDMPSHLIEKILNKY